MKNNQQGFTLIELMIVVAIIGILAAVALPAYQDYVAKSKITSIVASASSGKSAMFDKYSADGSFPADGTAADQIAESGSTTEGFYNTMMGLNYSTPANNTYAPNAAGDAGVFTIELANINANVNGKKLDFTYADSNGQLTFTCANNAGNATPIPDKYLPSQCQ